MTTFSKFFDCSIRNRTCQELFHPWTSSCHRAWLTVLLTIAPDAVKFFLPFILVPLFYNIRNNSYSDVKRSFEILLKMLINAFGSVMSAFYLMCLLNKTLGKFYIATVVVVPVILSSPISYILPLPIRRIYSQMFFSFVLEAAVKNSENPFIKTFRKSKIFSTLLFMFISGPIMYYLKISNYSLHWFIHPTKTSMSKGTTNTEISNKRYVENPEFPGWGQLKIIEKLCCDHNDLCDKHLLNGVITNAKFAFCIEVIKRIISSASLIKLSPIKFLQNIVVSTNYKFVKFLVTYGVLYRVSNCFFNRKFEKETPKTSLLAGFVAGIAFGFNPNYYFFSYGFSTLVQLIWHALGTNESQIIPHFEKLYNLPWSVILFGVFGGLMVHIRLFKPQLLPQLAIKATDMISNGHTKQISNRIEALTRKTI